MVVAAALDVVGNVLIRETDGIGNWGNGGDEYNGSCERVRCHTHI